MTNSLTVAAQNASSCSEKKKSSCKFCGKEGLLILPVRVGTLPVEAKAPALPKAVAAHAKTTRLVTSTYTLRIARVGYLYVLINRAGTLSWQCYISTAQGYWWQFAADTPPLAPPEFTCTAESERINASMISIPNATEVQTAYLFFTPSPLTVAMMGERKLKSIAAAESLCEIGQMVKFSPTNWVGGGRRQENCLDAAGIRSAVAEFVFYNYQSDPLNSPLAQAMLNSTFPLLNDGLTAESRKMALAEAVPQLVRLGPLNSYIEEVGAVAVAIYDHIGAVQELNDFRNDGLNVVEDFLNRSDKDGVTNRWKFTSLQALRELKVGYETGLTRDVPVLHADTALHIQAMHEPLFPEDTEQMTHYKQGRKKLSVYSAGRAAWRRAFPAEAARLDADLKKHNDSLVRKQEKAKADAAVAWGKRYASLIDHDAITSFDSAFGSESKAATALAAQRVADHLRCMSHPRLVDAFEFYDRADLISGAHFERQSALCTMGLAGTAKGAEQIDVWQNMPVSARENIYMRGLLLNQDKIVAEAASALAAAGNIAAAAPAPSLIPGDKMALALKNLIKFFAAADKAWDEYVRESEKPGNFRNKGLEKTWEGAKLFKLSELNRTIFRSGITNFEKRAVGFFGGLVFSKMGNLAEELNFNHLMYGIDPEKPHIDPKTKKEYSRGEGPLVKSESAKSPDSAKIESAEMAAKAARAESDKAAKRMMTIAQYRDMQRKAGIAFTAEEYLSRKSHMTSNYHQVRISGLLGVLETFAIAGKLHDIHKNGGGSGIEWAEASASLFAVASITCDLGYGMAKSARESTTVAAVKGAGDIVRGGWKLAAGALGAIAGVITVIVDFKKLSEEYDGKNRTGEKTVLIMRIGIGIWNTGAGAAAAWSYTGPLFRRAASTLASDALRRIATLAFFAKGAEWLSARIFLLRLVAWGTGAGLVLTLGEIGYHIYLQYQPTALEIWMKRSVFRKRALGGSAFQDYAEEIEELAKARQLVGL